MYNLTKLGTLGLETSNADLVKSLWSINCYEVAVGFLSKVDAGELEMNWMEKIDAKAASIALIEVFVIHWPTEPKNGYDEKQICISAQTFGHDWV